ncbi:F-box only protein 41 [Notothenia coriiceps]|uniref:F-box only protein 41 n=1 Tax=Notothenia coriiceps TaxID=8208 RepID=A0A6I9NEJ4_9TELE|nr:PREDICTED: F-box only protein 41-like [Notothenia coriiceps]
MHPMEDCPEAQYYMQCRLGEAGYDRSPGCGGGGSRNWGLRKQAIQNWQRRPYRNSTEGDEGDMSDVGSRTTESEMEMWEQDRRAVAEVQQSSPPAYSHHSRTAYRSNTGRSDGVYNKPCRHEKSPSKSNEVISPEILKMRAALFCIFTYLDTKTLLRAAEVCRDWKFVARHPAVWTRVLLENARISSKFLSTMSQWCTQTHSLILQNLKPRQRGKKETKEEYLKSTRGCLEEGLEALLKATGSNLLILKISHCPNLLTDRSLWLASCYCRALQAVTYRSATDPVGQEVIWALGAGCRDIISLQVAPLHPWEVAQIDQFLQETAAREANAKVRLQQFIEELLDRADRAEKQLQIISSCGTTPNGSLGRCSLQNSKGNGRQRQMHQSHEEERFEGNTGKPFSVSKKCMDKTDRLAA